jgi:hypothetical protein
MYFILKKCPAFTGHFLYRATINFNYLCPLKLILWEWIEIP